MARGDQRCPCGCHWNWGWLNGAFGNTKIAVSDVDGTVERFGHFLWIEAKRIDEELSIAQHIQLEQFSRKEKCVAIVLYGNRDTPAFMDVCRSGWWTGRREATRESVFDFISNWFQKANGGKL